MGCFLVQQPVLGVWGQQRPPWGPREPAPCPLWAVSLSPADGSPPCSRTILPVQATSALTAEAALRYFHKPRVLSQPL